MRLRTQLSLAFLFLAVLPLGGIVLYSYASSLAAFRKAAEAESLTLADEMKDRLGTARERLRRRITSLGERPLGALGIEGIGATVVPSEEILRKIAEGMGEALPYVESLEFIPTAPEAPAAPQPPPPGAPPGASAGAGQEDKEAVLYLHREVGQALGALQRVPLPGIPIPDLAGLQEQVRGLEERARALAEKSETLEARQDAGEARREVEVSRRQVEAAQRQAQAAAATVVAWQRQLSAPEREALEASRKRTERLMGPELDCPIRGQEEHVVGRVRAQVKAQALLGSILTAVRRDQGEVPFAVDAGGHVYTAGPSDEKALAGLPLTGKGEGAAREDRGWVIVTKREPESGVALGIARPIRESLQEMRRTAARNFAYGLALIGFAFVGVFPLSARMTRNLGKLSEGAERLASGDLEARVPVQSKDELGRLAATFNRMAEDLSEHQRRLLEGERLRKEQEIRERLLAAEHARKSLELEQARQFQLSLLPRTLPERADVEIAVHTRTATEVGGDYYDFHEAGDGGLTVAIGDATGHGAAAGTMVTVVKGLFTARAGKAAPAAFLAEANEVIKRMQLGRMAMALSLVELRGRRLRVASAGTPPVLLYRAAGRTVEEVCLHATPLGALADCSYPEWETEVAPGDTVLLMTDGFPELLGPEGEPLGYPRVAELFAAAAAQSPEPSPEAVIAELTAAADAWRGGQSLLDDVTFVVLKVRAAA